MQSHAMDELSCFARETWDSHSVTDGYKGSISVSHSFTPDEIFWQIQNATSEPHKPEYCYWTLGSKTISTNSCQTYGRSSDHHFPTLGEISSTQFGGREAKEWATKSDHQSPRSLHPGTSPASSYSYSHQYRQQHTRVTSSFRPDRQEQATRSGSASTKTVFRPCPTSTPSTTSCAMVQQRSGLDPG